MINHIKKKWMYYVIFLVTVIPKIINICLYAYPLLNPGDELYLFSVPATLAGYDWSSAMPEYRYYGPGFSVFFTPLFKYMEDPLVIYRTILIAIALIQGIVPILTCYIMEYYMGIKDKKFLSIVSILMGYSFILSLTYMYNEHIYAVVIWVVVLFLFKSFEYRENRKKQTFYSILLTIAMLYALTVHARGVTLMIALIIIYVLAWIFFRVRIVSVIPSLAILGVGYIGNKILTNNIIELVVGSISNVSSSETLQNTDVSYSIPTDILTNVYKQLAFIDIVVGQVNIWNVTLGGFAIVSIVLVLYLTWNLCTSKIERSEEIMSMWVVAMFCMACVGITMVGQGFSWNNGVASALEAQDNTADALRALTYIRYYYAYVPMITMIVVTYIYKNPKTYLHLYKYVLVFTIVLTGLWCVLILPFMYDSSIGWSGISKIYALLIWGEDANVYYRYLPSILSVIILTYFYKICCKYNKAIYISLVLLILAGSCYQYAAYSSAGTVKSDYEYTEQVVEIIDYLDEEGLEFSIYCMNQPLASGKYSVIRQMQFMLFNQSLIQGTPEDVEGNVLYVRVGEVSEETLSDEYKYFVFEEDLYLYVKGEELQEYVLEMIESNN